VRTGRFGALALASDGSRLAVVERSRVVMYECIGYGGGGEGYGGYGRQLWSLRVPTAPGLAAAHGGGPAARTPVELCWPTEGTQLFLLAAGRLAAVTDHGALAGLPAELAGVTDGTVAAVSPSGQLLALGTAGGQVLVFDRETATCHRPLGCGDPVRALAWHPGEHQLAVATDGAVQFWKNLGNWRLSVPRPDLRGATALAWPPGQATGTVLAVRAGGQVRLTTVQPGPPRRTAAAPGTGALTYTRDGRFLLVGVGDRLEALDRDLRPLGRVPAARTQPGEVSLCRDGYLAAPRDDTSVAVWRLPDAVVVPAVEAQNAAVRRWASRMSVTAGRTAAPRGGDYHPGLATATTLLGDSARRPAPAFSYLPDGDHLSQADDGALVRGPLDDPDPAQSQSHGQEQGQSQGRGRVRIRRVDRARARWRVATEPAPGGFFELALSADGRWLAAATANRIGRVQLVDVANQRVDQVLTGGQSPVWSPDGRLLAVPEPGEDPREIKVYDRSGHVPPRRLRAGEGVRRLAWSPDGRHLVGGGWQKVVRWDASAPDARDWRRQEPVPLGGRRYQALVEFSPGDGRYLAVTGGWSDVGPVTVLDVSSWEEFRSFGRAGGYAWAPALAWSPDGRLLAFPAADAAGAVEIWDVAAGAQLAVLDQADTSGARVWSLAWSPSGAELVATYTSGRVIQWRVGVAGGDGLVRAVPLPFGRDLLATLGSAAAVAGAAVPLSLLVDLLTVVVGGEAEGLRLAGRRGVGALRALRWGPSAGVGLAVMLAADLPGDPLWAAPEEAAESALEQALRIALTGPPVDPEPPPAPLREVGEAFGRVDEQVLDLLAMLGQEAVSADPSLPARLRWACPSLPALSPRQRKLLDLRVTLTEEGGAQGRGRGEERAGLTRRGDLDQLVPTQLALPDDVLEIRLLRDELLYRTRQGRPPFGPQPSILLLDNTAAAQGAVGVTLRTSAHLLASTLLGLRRPCVLITLGGPPSVQPIGSTDDLLAIWTSGTTLPPDPEHAFALAEAVTGELIDPVTGMPRLIVLSHPYIDVPGRLGAHALAVHYPGRPVSRAASRTHLIAPDPEPGALATALASLLTDGD
jgi:WD40 repeat protein